MVVDKFGNKNKEIRGATNYNNYDEIPPLFCDDREDADDDEI